MTANSTPVATVLPAGAPRPGTQLILFDYSALSHDTATYVHDRTHQIRTLARRTGTQIVEIGQRLREVRDRLGGRFSDWLEAEFRWSDRDAATFIAVAEAFPALSDAHEIQRRALYLLARESTPEAARKEALERAEQGEKITTDVAAEIIAGHKAHEPRQRHLESAPEGTGDEAGENGADEEVADLAAKAFESLSPEQQQCVVEQRRKELHEDAGQVERPGREARLRTQVEGHLEKALKAARKDEDVYTKVIVCIREALRELAML